ncbi:MAG TPA: sigma-70 family RNA polymerase sigma factor [Microlunatus sp.]|nr:sigma-70 family RNA polymerase sigma factor [Microlunatus sp.]
MTLATSVDETFMAMVEPLRGELTAHCYRMLGSVHDAEDLVQETYLRAWKAYHNFENRSSVRTWMYQIATNACLSALGSKHRRTLPTGVGQPSGTPSGELETRHEIAWLEPLPDSVVWQQAADDPGDEIVSKESIRLAFVAALQHLTPPQRAVLILRDVLAWQASEVAEALELSVAAVNSSLQRARAHLAKVDPEAEQPTDALDDPRTRQLLEDYVDAFEAYDVARIVALLKTDAVWEMPPFTAWYRGTEAIRHLVTNYCPAEGPGDQRMVPVGANGQPAFGLYMRDENGVHRAFQIQQLELRDGQVAHVVAYFDTSLFEKFGLPTVLPAR